MNKDCAGCSLITARSAGYKAGNQYHQDNQGQYDRKNSHIFYWLECKNDAVLIFPRKQLNIYNSMWCKRGGISSNRGSGRNSRLLVT